jgi:ADP-heptose:LPS heptosyltransferase
MHMADALGTPMVVLFSGTELESQWAPRRAPAHLLRRPTDCSPCYASACPYEMQCLYIAPETVVRAAIDLLRAADASRARTSVAAPAR